MTAHVVVGVKDAWAGQLDEPMDLGSSMLRSCPPWGKDLQLLTRRATTADCSAAG